MKRSELIKRIKSWNLSHDDMAALAEVIPELRESEEERAKKIIASIFSDAGYRYIQKSERDIVLAYLEKQKENIEKEYVFRPLAGTDINSAVLQAIRRADEGDRLVLAFNGAYIPVRKGVNANKIVDIYDAFIEKQKEQKQSETEKEYVKTLKGLVSDFIRDTCGGITDVAYYQKICDWLEGRHIEQKPADLPPGFYFIDLDGKKYYSKEFRFGDMKMKIVEDKSEKPAEWSKNDTVFLNEITDFFENQTVRLQHDIDMYVHWLKSLPERFNLQPKEEWSEKDEGLLERAISIIGWAGSCADKYKIINPDGAAELQKFLKSLRPSWKPSEDEERLTNTSISFLKDFADKGYENAVECIDWLKSKLDGNTCE